MQTHTIVYILQNGAYDFVSAQVQYNVEGFHTIAIAGGINWCIDINLKQSLIQSDHLLGRKIYTFRQSSDPAPPMHSGSVFFYGG